MSEDFTAATAVCPRARRRSGFRGGRPSRPLLPRRLRGDARLSLPRSRTPRRDALVYGQRPEGGWHYFIDFDPKGTEEWYRTEASRFKWGYEEYRHYYGNATFDDGNSAVATRYLLRFYATTLEAPYREPLVKALDFFVKAQYPNGAWPQRYPLRFDFSHDGFPDYTSFYTLNDGAARRILRWSRAMSFSDEAHLAASKRGVDS